MRSFLHKIVSWFGASLWLRSRLLPSGETAIVVARQVDPVQEFYKELNIKMGGEDKTGGLTGIVNRIFKSFQFKDEDSPKAGTIIYWSGLIGAEVGIMSGVANATAASAMVGFVAGAVLGLVIGMISSHDPGDRSAATLFRCYMVAMLAFVMVAIFVQPWWFGCASLLVLFLAPQIINYPADKSVVASSKTPEQLVADAFDRFLAKNFPDIDKKRSSLDREITIISAQISEAGEVLAKMRGELRGDEISGGRWSDIIQANIQEMEVGIAEKGKRKKALQSAKDDFVSAIQGFKSIKDEATTATRLDELRRKGRRSLGLADEAISRGETYLESITGDLRQALERVNQAVENLRLATLPGLEDGGSVNALYVGAEAAGESSGEAEQIVRDLAVMN